MDLRAKRAIVIGLGRSGVAAAELLLARGARVVANDAAARDKLGEATLGLEKRGAELRAGGHDAHLLDGADLVVISPGVPSFAALDAFERAGGEVIGEMELASRFVTAPIALIG